MFTRNPQLCISSCMPSVCWKSLVNELWHVSLKSLIMWTWMLVKCLVHFLLNELWDNSIHPYIITCLIFLSAWRDTLLSVWWMIVYCYDVQEWSCLILFMLSSLEGIYTRWISCLSRASVSFMIISIKARSVELSQLHNIEGLSNLNIILSPIQYSVQTSVAFKYSIQNFIVFSQIIKSSSIILVFGSMWTHLD